MTLFRPHRGQLADSLAEAVPCTTREELIALVTRGGWAKELVSVEPYPATGSYDERCGWHTHIVVVRWCNDHVGAFGMTDGPLPVSPS